MRTGPAILLEPSQMDGLAAVLTRAYYDEPHFKYIMPDEQTRLRLLPGCFREAIRATQSFGEIHTTYDLEGGALWIGPGRGFTIRRTMRSRFPSITLQFCSTNLQRCIRLGLKLDKVHQRLVSRPHWYLLALGVDPSTQRESVGSSLIEPILARADSNGLPCYLETFNAKDLPFYTQRGFRIAGGGKIATSGPDFWAMIRVPRSS
jgi:GNAT superfamily N-acetyltransferase